MYSSYGSYGRYAMNSEMASVTLILSLGLAVLMIISQWKLFTKAGEPGWAAIVPLYNTYVLFKISWGNGWFFLLLLIPIVNLVILIITYVKLASVFGKSGGFAVGLIFLNLIFSVILAFGNAQYIGIMKDGSR